MRKLLDAPGRDVVLVYTFAQDFYADMMADRVPPTIAGLERLGTHYGLGSVWMSLYALREVMAGMMRWEEWLPDGLHPQARGSLSYGQSVIAFLQEELAGNRQIPQPSMGLPEPLNPRHWGGAVTLPLEQVRTSGPWTLRRWYNCPFIPYVWDTAAMTQANFRVQRPGRLIDWQPIGRVPLPPDGGDWRQTARASTGLAYWLVPAPAHRRRPTGRRPFAEMQVHGNARL